MFTFVVEGHATAAIARALDQRGIAIRRDRMPRMMRSWLLGLALLLAINATDTAGAQRQDVTLWVTLGDADQLVEVDADAFKEIRRITTDPRPHGSGPKRILVAKKP